MPCLMSLSVLRGTIPFWRREDSNWIGEPLLSSSLTYAESHKAVVPILNLIVHEVLVIELL